MNAAKNKSGESTRALPARPALSTLAGDAQYVFKIGVRLPPFWSEEQTLWFSQMEGQFVLSGVTADSIKFNYVISQLENKYAIEAKDIINNPPSDNKYAKLKAELIRRLSASQEKKVQ